MRTLFMLVALTAFTLLQAGGQIVPANPVTTQQISMPVFTLNPAPAINASIQLSGNPGPQTIFYWIVANYPVGNATPAGPFAITNAPNTLSATNFVEIAPILPPQASSYDLLKTSSTIPPGGACACAVATGVVPGTVTNDQSNTTGAYTVNTVNTSMLGMKLQNEVQSAGVSHLILRQNGAFVADLSVGAGATPGGVNTQLQVNNGGVFGAIPNFSPGYYLTSKGTAVLPAFQLKPQVDVRDYGVFGDGTTAHTLLQADINANTQWLGCGTVDTSGTAVTWDSGAKFYPTLASYNVNIGGSDYAVSSIGATTAGVATTLTLGSSAGTQAGVRWCMYSTGDQWDYVGLQEAFFTAFGAPGAEHSSTSPNLNREVIIPTGDFKVNKSLNLTHCVGCQIRGAMRQAVRIDTITPNTSILVTNGMSFSRISGIFFSSVGVVGPTAALLEINWDGSTTNWTQGLQGNHFEDNLFSAEGSGWQIGVRIGGSGFMGSENLFLNNHFNWFTNSCYVSGNFNALQNTFVGGNFQNCSGDGIHVGSGSVYVYSVGFQNGSALSTPAQTGCDIRVLNSAGDTDVVENSRTESATCFFQGGGGAAIRLSSNHMAPLYSYWQASHSYTAPLASIVTPPVASTKFIGGSFQLTSGSCTSGASEPTWTYTTTSDGTCTWTYLPSTFANPGGPALIENNSVSLGSIQGVGTAAYQSNIANNVFSHQDWLNPNAGGPPFGNANNSVAHSGNLVYMGGNNVSGGQVSWSDQNLAIGFGAGPFYSRSKLGDMPQCWQTGLSGLVDYELCLAPANATDNLRAYPESILALWGPITPGSSGNNVKFGRPDANPGTNVSQINQAQDISSGRGTGNATPSVTKIWGPVAGASGTALQSLVPRAVFNDTKQLTSGSATTVVSSTIAADQRAGGMVRYFIEATDTTNHHNCTLTGEISYVAENTAATVVANASSIGLPATTCDGVNTLAVTWAQTAATPSLTQVTPTLTGFTATQFQIVYSVESFGQSQTVPTF